MNIFILDNNPKLSAQYECNKHIVKMVTETSQLISYIYHIKGEKINPILHKLLERHKTHPCTLWLLESKQNFIWLCNFGILLYNEYQYRYNQPTKHQRAFNIFQYGLKNVPNLPNIELTEFARAIKKNKYPDLLDKKLFPNIVDCYREYYWRDKQHLFKWTKRNIPSFIQDYQATIQMEEDAGITV